MLGQKILNPTETVRDSSMLEYMLKNGIITVDECAALSSDVYYDMNDAQRPSLPLGWIRYKDSGHSENDYFGACYIRRMPKKVTCVAFAHRGTVLSKVGSVKSALESALESIPSQFASAKLFWKACMDDVYGDDKKKEDTFLINTGHSLGGVLAELLSVDAFGSLFIPCITFENPGTKNMARELYREFLSQWIPPEKLEKAVADYMDYMSKCSYVYQADVNLINTCNEQAGTTFRLADLPYDYYVVPGLLAPEDIKPLFYLNPHYLAGYTSKDQHRIENIYNYLKAHGNVRETKYPHGFENGYIAYLDYNSRQDYWLNYFKTYWDLNPILKVKYLDNFDLFHKYAKNQLEETRNTAISMLPKSSSELNIPDSSEKLAPSITSSLQTVTRPATSSQLGLFANNKSTQEAIDDFVIIEKDTSIEDAKQQDAPKHRCAIM